MGYECKLRGKAYLLADLVIGNWTVDTALVYTTIEYDAEYHPDIQVDGGFMHDEGQYDYDEEDYTIVDPEEFVKADLVTPLKDNTLTFIPPKKNEKIHPKKSKLVFVGDLDEV